VTAPALVHDTACESELTSHGYTPCRCAERVAICYCRKNPCACVPVPLAAQIPLEHDYTIDAAILASFLRSAYPDLRTQAAIVLLALATSAFDRRRLPVIGDVAVYVCAGAIWDATATYSRSWESCATLAHLACREYARQVAADPAGRVDQHCLLAIGGAAAAVLS